MQAVFTSAAAKAQYIREATAVDAAEADKLLQRQVAAKAQYDQGLAKLRATSRQLQSLASRVNMHCIAALLAISQDLMFMTRLILTAYQVKSTENAAERLIRTLRELPSKEALALRSEVASKVSLHVHCIALQCLLLQKQC